MYDNSVNEVSIQKGYLTHEISKGDTKKRIRNNIKIVRNMEKNECA